MKLEPKDQVQFQGIFSNLVGFVQQVQGNKAWVSLTVPGFGRYTFVRAVKELTKVDNWIKEKS